MKEEVFVEDYKVSREEAETILVGPSKYECPWCGYIGTATVNMRVTDIEPMVEFGPFCMICIGKFLERNFRVMNIVEEEKEDGEETG